MAKAKAKREDQIAHILAEVASGRPVSRVLVEDEGMPSKSEFWRWHLSDEDLRGNLADARANGVEAMLDEAKAIADDAEHDWVKKAGEEDDEPEWLFNKENVLRSKLRVETRVKLAQMLKPRTYGPKLDLTSGGEKLGLSAEIEAARRRTAEEG